MAGSGVLLDTCALIWFANGNRVSETAQARFVQAGLHDGAYVSYISAWEIGMLSLRRSRSGKPPVCGPDAKTWFRQIMARPGIRQALLTVEIAIDASILPGDIHGDPADRLMVATARMMDIPLITRDRKLIAYAEQGHVEVIAC